MFTILLWRKARESEIKTSGMTGRSRGFIVAVLFLPFPYRWTPLSSVLTTFLDASFQIKPYLDFRANSRIRLFKKFHQPSQASLSIVHSDGCFSSFGPWLEPFPSSPLPKFKQWIHCYPWWMVHLFSHYFSFLGHNVSNHLKLVPFSDPRMDATECSRCPPLSGFCTANRGCHSYVAITSIYAMWDSHL